MPPFEWHGRSKAHHGTFCDWCGLRLYAFPTGEWKVARGTTVIDHYGNTTARTNLQGAQRRAQAAAMVIHQLAQNP